MKRNRIAGLVFGLLSSVSNCVMMNSWGANPSPKPAQGIQGAEPRAAEDGYFLEWKAILDRSVSMEGSRSWVDYPALKKSPQILDEYLSHLSKVSEAEFASWSETKRLSFLINAYNAFTVKLIVDHYPLSSIKDIGGLFKKPWGIEFISLLGKKVSLDQIEHQTIRKQFSEPRIHLALVCAAKSCPPLKAYSAKDLSKQLDANTEIFLRDPKCNRFDPKEKVLYLSSIFKWYGDDFKAKFETVARFVAPRIAHSGDEEKLILSEGTEIKYLDYDWSLNGK